MCESNINYCIMGGDVGKVYNGALQGGLRLQRSKENVSYVLGTEYEHAIIPHWPLNHFFFLTN